MSSEIGARVMAAAAWRAVLRTVEARAEQWPAWRSRSTVRLSRRAMSPSSRLQSDMTCVQALPAAHASTTPAHVGKPVRHRLPMDCA